jgi:hypothetical protein
LLKISTYKNNFNKESVNFSFKEIFFWTKAGGANIVLFQNDFTYINTEYLSSELTKYDN